MNVGIPAFYPRVFVTYCRTPMHSPPLFMPRLSEGLLVHCHQTAAKLRERQDGESRIATAFFLSSAH